MEVLIFDFCAALVYNNYNNKQEVFNDGKKKYGRISG